MINLDATEASTAQGCGHLFAIVSGGDEHERTTQLRAVSLNLIGDPVVDDRAVCGPMRHAEVKTVDGFRRHIPLERLAMCLAPEGAFTGQELPGILSEMGGMIGVRMDVIDLVGDEIFQFTGQRQIMRSQFFGVSHDSGLAMGREWLESMLVQQNTQALASRHSLAQVNQQRLVESRQVRMAVDGARSRFCGGFEVILQHQRAGGA
jgi:hypothetical protein